MSWNVLEALRNPQQSQSSNTKQRPPTDEATRKDIRLNRLYRSAIFDKAPRTMISQYDVEHRLRGNSYEVDDLKKHMNYPDDTCT